MHGECRERFPRHCVLEIPTCIRARAWRTCRDACPRSLTSGFLRIRWRRKRSRYSRCMRNPQFCLSGKRPMYFDTNYSVSRRMRRHLIFSEIVINTEMWWLPWLWFIEIFVEVSNAIARFCCLEWCIKFPQIYASFSIQICVPISHNVLLWFLECLYAHGM